MFNDKKCSVLTFAIAVAKVMLILPVNSAIAQSQSDISFSEGSVLLYCTTKDNREIPEEFFEDAFPQWVVALQNFAKEGVVLKAHYLPDLRSGVFIVVGGDSLEDAKNNVGEVESSSRKILDTALSKAGIENPYQDSCLQIEIGPVAITGDN